MAIFRHSREISPFIIPNGAEGTPIDVHGLTSVNIATSQDGEDVFVVGKSDRCAVDKGTPEGTVSFPLLERGTMGLLLTLANKDAVPDGGLTLVDFSGALVDYVQYERETENGDVVSSKVLPRMALSSFALELTADERITNTIELTNDNKHELNFDNKYYIHKKATVGSGDGAGAYAVDVSDPAPQPDPNNSGRFILRVDRVRNDETATLIEGTDFTYDSTPASEEVEITEAEVDDIYHVYYTSDEFGSAGDPTTVDNAQNCFIKSDSVTVLIGDGNTEVALDVLTTLSITSSIENLDEAVIGREGFAVREIENTPVDVSIGGRIKDSSILLAFMGKIGVEHGITDINRYLENVSVTVKIYSDATKTTFLKGYKTTGLSFTGDSNDFTAGEFGELTVDANSTNLLITDDEGDL